MTAHALLQGNAIDDDYSSSGRPLSIRGVTTDTIMFYIIGPDMYLPQWYVIVTGRKDEDIFTVILKSMQLKGPRSWEGYLELNVAGWDVWC